jgi:hypothetical protein
MEDHDQVSLLIAPAFHAIIDFPEDIGFQILQGRQGGGSAHGGWGLGLGLGLGLEKDATAHAGGAARQVKKKQSARSARAGTDPPGGPGPWWEKGEWFRAVDSGSMRRTAESRRCPGGRRPGLGTLHRDPITKRGIGGKPAGECLFITNGRNLEMPRH